MKQKTAIDAYLEQADHHAEVAKSLYESKHYDWTLFMWHLVLEKTLKAIIIKQAANPPFIHDLERLANYAKLQLSNKQRQHLKEITTFNLEARYDDYKSSFYKKANKAYTKKWIAICEGVYKDLKQLC